MMFMCHIIDGLKRQRKIPLPQKLGLRNTVKEGNAFEWDQRKDNSQTEWTFTVFTAICCFQNFSK